MPLFPGIQLTFGEALSVCSYVGFDYGHGLIRAVAVADAESGRKTDAVGHNYADDGVTILSVDRGWFQWNDVAHPEISDEDAFSVIAAARFAYEASNHGEDFSQWNVFRKKSPRYLLAMVRAKWFYTFGTGWRRRIAHVEELFP